MLQQVNAGKLSKVTGRLVGRGRLSTKTAQNRLACDGANLPYEGDTELPYGFVFLRFFDYGC